jgi:hypothetical protein
LDESTVAKVAQQRADALATPATAVRWSLVIVVVGAIVLIAVIVAVFVLVVH